MQKKKTDKKQTPVVRQPYLTGSPYDSNVLKSALGLVGGTLGMAVVFLLLGGMLSFNSRPLTIVLNIGLLALAYILFYTAGSANGSVAVNQGEIMYRRRETNREISAGELARAFHPAKGFVIGVIGMIPALIVALLLAFTAQRQMYTAGQLPSWVTAFSGETDVFYPLLSYTVIRPISMEGVARVIVRLLLLPYVNILGTDGSAALLILERLSPILVLIPGVCYGVGYLSGVKIRSRVHTEIAANDAKRRRKEQKKRRQRMSMTPKEPQKLN